MEKIKNNKNSDNLSVLVVTSQLPWPLNAGGYIRTFYLVRALARRFRVRLIAPVKPGEESSIEQLQQQGITVCRVPMGARKQWREGIKAITSALRGLPYVMYRRHDYQAVRNAIADEVARERPDVAYLDACDPLVYARCFTGIPMVMDLHNVYSALARSTAEVQSRWFLRSYLRREARLLERVEKRVCDVTTVISCVSEPETEYFTSLGGKHVYLIPNGVDCSVYESLPVGRSVNPPTILYVGAMSWQPNAQAVHFLAKEVLPRVRLKIPDARLQIVGRDPSRDVLALQKLPGVEVTGTVPQILPYLNGASLLAVSLEAGGGTRLKILEAFAAGLPVVSTPLGCEGLRVENNEHLIIASRDQFAESILSLLNDNALQHRLAERARALALEQYDWTSIGDISCRAVEDAVRFGQ